MPSIVARPSSLGSRIGETASIGPGPAHPHCARFASDPVGGSAHGNIAGGPTRATPRYDVTVASRPDLMPRGWPLLDDSSRRWSVVSCPSGRVTVHRRSAARHAGEAADLDR